MLLKELAVFEVLSTPIWVVHPFNERVVYANQASRTLSGEMSLNEMRNGIYSTCPETQLQHYLRYLDTMSEIFEVWTLPTANGLQSVYCKTTLIDTEDCGCLLLFEAVKLLAQNQSIHTGSRRYQRRNNGFFARFFMTNTAPMLLIDPHKDGRIVDANIAALRFYHYSDEEMRTKHTWQINTLGRDVIPIMNNIASLPGGHKPLNFTHILADGSLRHVQTYAGPVVLLNRREFHRLVEAPTFIPRGYCLLLIDIDHFKSINDIHGHQKGDEVLLVLSRILETSVDREDKIYRWGGEEFLLFLPHSPIGRALILAEGIRQAVSEYQTLSVTVSIGVAEHHDGETVEQLFSRVDKALYAAKNDGRNRVTRMPFDSSERRRSRDGAA
ncbi:sensor domain-containing diguanylate cyclase [Klebsiella pneumoniae]|uniref:sensor domain-containing diguanylate cyclase n=1 Tax=Klebsiella pneumoniae TaxID=573 RepID=UPI001126DE13|nr:sensor domain-containing diguanylate cyclase [Klebsiella pneumoniae]TPQ75889.1 GGDEF domain-containing protein [Klebsiella pneumoniae]